MAELEAEEARIRADYAARVEAHLDAPLTRRALIDVLDQLKREHTNGPPESQRLADAFALLSQELYSL